MTGQSSEPRGGDMRTDATVLRIAAAELTLATLTLPVGTSRTVGLMADLRRALIEQVRHLEQEAATLDRAADAISPVPAPAGVRAGRAQGCRRTPARRHRRS